MRLSKEGFANLKNQEEEKAVEGEVTQLGQPDHIDADTWALIQDTGRLASERLYEILSSPKFTRLRAGDQAKLIKLAQDRAYGAVAAKKEVKKFHHLDVTAEHLNDLVKRARLPEYRKGEHDGNDNE